MLTPRSSFVVGCFLLTSILTPALLQAADEGSLPDLGTPAANTATAQPNIDAQGAGFNYNDNIDGKLISINPQYTKQNGVAVGGSLASPISKNMAVGILLTAGSDKNEWLLNTGFDLTSNQRFIFSLGQLRQKQDFNFISGSQKARITQDNLALSYQYLLGKDWLNAAELNGYISDAGSVTLGDKAYLNDTLLDPRRIAGGRVTGVQGKLVFTPTPKTILKVGLGAERLTYDYLTGDQSTTRATGSAELVQRLDNDFNFRASANAASSQNRYALGLGRSFKGGSQFGIDIATIQGRDNTFNDNQLFLSYTQNFGGTNTSALGRNAFNTNNLALNESDATGAPTNHPYTNTATPNQTSNTWTSPLVEQVSRRPSFIPAQVIAKIDHTALPKTLAPVPPPPLPAGYVSTERLGTAGTIEFHEDKTSRLNGGGTLIWSKNNSTFPPSSSPEFSRQGAYIDAVNACAAMNASSTLGYSSGWRLPTQQELSGFYNRGYAAMNASGWSLFDTWSATTGANKVYMGTGIIGNSEGHSYSYASCVH